jgi:hypothetical protein
MMATANQVDFMRRLIQERQFPNEAAKQWAEQILSQGESVDMARMSKILQRLLTLPKVNTNGGNRLTRADLPEGKYALLTPQAQNEISFFSVWHPPDSETAIIISQLFGAPGSWRRKTCRGQRYSSIAQEIAADPKAAMARFGLHFTVCGRCGSPLTNDLSRELGIGPDCRQHLGW